MTEKGHWEPNKRGHFFFSKEEKHDKEGKFGALKSFLSTLRNGILVRILGCKVSEIQWDYINPKREKFIMVKQAWLVTHGGRTGPTLKREAQESPSFVLVPTCALSANLFFALCSCGQKMAIPQFPRFYLLCLREIVLMEAKITGSRVRLR